MWKHVETLDVSFGCHLDRPVPLVRPTGDERPVQGAVLAHVFLFGVCVV